MDRIALVAFLWFVGWTVAAFEVGKVAFNAGISGALLGFMLALLTAFAWPWIMPRPVDDWMHDPFA